MANTRATKSGINLAMQKKVSYDYIDGAYFQYIFINT